MTKVEDLFQLGFSRLDAPVDAREKAAVDDAGLVRALTELSSRGGACELALLSTCSRLEIYGAAEDPDETLAAARRWLLARGGAALEGSLVVRRGAVALDHLCRVASGLESWIVGESEILGQVKRAYEGARKAGFTGPVLNRVFQSATAAGKAARARTGLQNGVRSIGGAAALLARKIFGPSGDGAVVVFGAGEAAEAAVRHLTAKGFRQVFVANRTSEKALELASRVGGLGLSLADGLRLLESAEIAVFSTSSPEPLLREAALRAAMTRRSKPLFVIDLGMPRNVEESCARVPEVFLYGLSELREVVSRSVAAKADDVRAAETIVAKASAACACELEKAALMRADASRREAVL